MMDCGSEFQGSSPVAPVTPPPTLPLGAATGPYSSPRSSSSRHNDICFCCRKQGHWAINCPSKSSKRSQQSDQGRTSDDHDFPYIQCHCGRKCRVIISHTAKNPNKPFYRCPLFDAMKCKFFKWCDEVSSKKKIMCSCGAGICRKETKTSGPDAGRSYFVCPIKQGFGACNFMQWEDTLEDNTVNERIDELRECDSPQSHCDSLEVFETANNNFHKSDDSCPQDFQDFAIVSLSSEQDDVSHVDESAESLENVTRKDCRVSRLVTRLDIQKRQAEFWREIVAAGDISSKGDIPYEALGLCVLGWLGRLAFPPIRGISECPPKPFHCGIFPTFEPIFVPQDPTFEPIFVPQDPILPSFDSITSSIGNLSPPTTDGDPLLENNVLCKPMGPRKRSFMESHEGDFMQSISSILEQTALRVQNELVTRLNSMDPSNYDSMTRLAKGVFSTLDNLSIDYAPFYGDVKEFIYSSSRLAKLEKSIGSEHSFEKLDKVYSIEKSKLVKIVQDHDAAVAALEASEKRLLSLQEEASNLREMLLIIEKEEKCCADETSNYKTRVDVISREKLEWETKVERAEEVRRLGEEREEAKAALEKARIKLDQYIGA